MKVRFYLAPQKGDGSYFNPFTSIIVDYIDLTSGSGVEEMDSPSRRISLCYVLATETEHASIEADNRVIPISYLMEPNDSSSIDNDINTLPSISSVKAKLEGLGISCEWISNNSMRDLIRYIVKLFHVTQKLNLNDNAMVFLRNNLTTMISDILLAVRNTVKNWMQSKGLAIDWITNSTTVRGVLHFIITNLVIGKFKFHGLEF